MKKHWIKLVLIVLFGCRCTLNPNNNSKHLEQLLTVDITDSTIDTIRFVWHNLNNPSIKKVVDRNNDMTLLHEQWFHGEFPYLEIKYDDFSGKRYDINYREEFVDTSLIKAPEASVSTKRSNKQFQTLKIDFDTYPLLLSSVSTKNTKIIRNFRRDTEHDVLFAEIDTASKRFILSFDFYDYDHKKIKSMDKVVYTIETNIN